MSICLSAKKYIHKNNRNYYIFIVYTYTGTHPPLQTLIYILLAGNNTFLVSKQYFGWNCRIVQRILLKKKTQNKQDLNYRLLGKMVLLISLYAVPQLDTALDGSGEWLCQNICYWNCVRTGDWDGGEGVAAVSENFLNGCSVFFPTV